MSESESDTTDATTVTPTGPSTDTEVIEKLSPDDPADELTKDTLFELLKNQRRRDAITYLKANDGRATLSDMAEHIAAKENDLPVERINSKQRKRVYIGLYQCHLPKMADAGVVAFDKDRGTIELDDLAAQLDPYLDRGEVGEDATGATGVEDDVETGATDRVGGPATEASVLAGVGVAALVGVAGVPGFRLLSPTVWTVVCATVLLVTAALPFVRG